MGNFSDTAKVAAMTTVVVFCLALTAFLVGTHGELLADVVGTFFSRMTFHR